MKKLTIFLAIITFIYPLAYSQIHGELEKATINVAEEIGKSVVSISSVVKEKIGKEFYFGSPYGELETEPFNRFFEEFFGGFPEREFRRMGLGSGVIIDKEGYILTNEHVIAGASEIKVKLPDGREFDAEVKGMDKRSDLAVIKINASDLYTAKLGDSDGLKIGKWVIAVGNPFGFAIENPEPTITVGVISALHRYLPALGRRERSYDDLIQTDAAINPGNSGGPLVNLEGEVIGVNTAIITTSGGYQGVGFAIPINKAKRVLGKLVKGEKILYGWLGVNIQDLNEDLRNYFRTKENEGVIVVKVYKDSPADKGGLKEGDLILSFNNQIVKKTKDLIGMVSSFEVGAIVPIKIIRESKEIVLDVKIGKSPEDLEKLEEQEFQAEDKTTMRGLKVADLSAAYKQQFRTREDEGVVVVYIEEGSPADKSGLMVGDVITKLSGKTVKNKEDFISVTSKIKGSWLLNTNRGFLVVKDK
jgi:serine protease Do